MSVCRTAHISWIQPARETRPHCHVVANTPPGLPLPPTPILLQGPCIGGADKHPSCRVRAQAPAETCWRWVQLCLNTGVCTGQVCVTPVDITTCTSQVPLSTF